MKPDANRLRDELWWAMREWFESRIVRIEAGESDRKTLDRFIHEATSPKYSILSTGKIQVESKDAMRRADRIGRSPNLADAACLTFAKGDPGKGRNPIPRLRRSRARPRTIRMVMFASRRGAGRKTKRNQFLQMRAG
jgi:hypothetical protein